MRDAAGRVTGVLLFGIDVSDHVRDRRRPQELADGLARSEEPVGYTRDDLESGRLTWDLITPRSGHT